MLLAAAPRRGRWRTWVIVVLFALIAGPAGLVAVLWPLTPSVADAEQRITSRLAQHQAHDPHALPQPDKVGAAIVATEDSRFYAHHGLDVVGVARAAVTAVSGSGQDAGGATLDQQLAKNLYAAGGLTAKAEQLELAFKLEANYTKPQILEMYLSTVYFGHGFYGLPAASRGYFGDAPADLSWAQASLLAGLVQAPSAYDPYRHRDLAKSRQRHVLDRLVADHVLRGEQADAASHAQLDLR